MRRPASVAASTAFARLRSCASSVVPFVAVLALAVCAGCRLLNTPAGSDQPNAASAINFRERALLAQETRTAAGDWIDQLLEEYLSQDRWQVDKHWSVLAELDAAWSTAAGSATERLGLDVAVIHRNRWQFGQDSSSADPSQEAQRSLRSSGQEVSASNRRLQRLNGDAPADLYQKQVADVGCQRAPQTKGVARRWTLPATCVVRAQNSVADSGGQRVRLTKSRDGGWSESSRQNAAGARSLIRLRRTANGGWENAPPADAESSSRADLGAGKSTRIDRSSKSSKDEIGGSSGKDEPPAEGETPEAEPGQFSGTSRSNSPTRDASSDSKTGSRSPWNGFWPLSPLQWLGEKAASCQSDRTLLERLARLAGRDDLVGINAAILWAGESPLVALPVANKLERVVADEDKRWSDSLRAAAAEAWCRVLAASVEAQEDAAVEQALAPAGRLLLRTDLPEPVRCELFRGCARWISPDRIPRLANALTVGPDGQRAPVAVRRAALEACVLFAGYRAIRATQSTLRSLPDQATADEASSSSAEPTTTARSEPHRSRPMVWPQYDEADYPPSVWNARSDPDSQVRVLFGCWLATARPPDACRLLQRQLDDSDPQVREAAFEALGRLHTAAALNVLRQQARHSAPRRRQLAVRGLAAWGPSELQRLADDEAYVVREEVARQLARFPSARAAVLLQQLVGDRNPQVQQAAVSAVSSWPDDLATAVLLLGLLDGTLTTRQQCRERLSKRLGTWLEFAVEAPRAERAQAVLRLCRQYGLSASLVDSLQKELAEAARDLRVLPERQAEIEQWLQTLIDHPWPSEAAQQAWQRLQHVGSNEAWVVERFALEHADTDSVTVLYDKVLPELSRTWELLKQLESEDVTRRRQAAQQLAVLGEQQSLSPAATQRLHDLLAREQDGLVWRLAMQAVLPDDTEQAAQIALLAVNHTWPDIRRLGCLYVQKHPHSQYATWLIPLLNDTNRTVQLEAVRALGMCRNPIALDGLPASQSQPASRDVARGLRDLLTSPDRSLRMAVAVSMAKLGDEQGIKELIRLSYDTDPSVRIEVVRAMAETGRTRFVDHLVQLAWIERHAIVKREILKALEQLVPPENQPPALAAAQTDQQKVEAWAEWWQQHAPGSPVSTVGESHL